MARPLVDKKNLSLICNIPPGLPQMYQDANRIGQILNNLLSNAIKFTPEGGQISVNVRRAMGVIEGAKGEPARESVESDAAAAAEPVPLLEIKVTDSGVGISPEDRQIIFEKFRQAGSSFDATITREYSGSGLGLSIVKELCRLLEGDISVESRLGFGSVFTVRVPWEFRAPNLQQSPILSELREFGKIRPEGRKPEM